MRPVRKTSLIFGLFFAGTFIFSIPALAFYDSILHDADYILETFHIVRKDDDKAHGEYRTKRVILEIYDAMAEATRSAMPAWARTSRSRSTPGAISRTTSPSAASSITHRSVT